MGDQKSDLYVRKRGKVYGPYDFESLQDLAQRGKLSRIHQVSEDGINWIVAENYQPSIWGKFTVPDSLKTDIDVQLRPTQEEAESRKASSVAEIPEVVPTNPRRDNQMWHYTKNEEEMDPVNFSQLCQLFTSGGLSSNEEVWTDGMANWIMAAQVPELQPCFVNPQHPVTDNPASGFQGNESDRRTIAKSSKNEDNPFYWYATVCKQYVNFSGRARRKEYWYFILCNVGIYIILNIFSVLIGDAMGLLGSLYNLALLLPGLGVVIRRLHDTGRSGWWCLIPLIPFVGFIVLLVFMAQSGDAGQNQYGHDPIE